MIAPWLFELLRRERDWRAALPTIATKLSELPEDRIRAALDLGAAFEHLEPDRRHAISAYQLAGPGRDRGRSCALAMEMGWWPAVGRLAHLDFQATQSLEPLIVACRVLLDHNPDAAARLFANARLGLAAKADPRLTGLRAELDGHRSEWAVWNGRARELTGAAAADAFVTASRLARAAGQADWASHLEAALAADPHHAFAAAVLTDAALGGTERKAIFDMMKVRLAGLESAAYCDALRGIATRLALEPSQHHAGLARRLLKAVIERAYTDGVLEIPGHLAMWTILDTAATEDGRRTELLPLILRGLDETMPTFDRVWLAALGASICAGAGDRDAARAYAAVVADHAPSHPVVLELLADSSAAASADVRHDLDALELDAATLLPVEKVIPEDLLEVEVDLAPLSRSPAENPHAKDPRFIDFSVPVLEDVPDPPTVAYPSQRPPATPPAKPAVAKAPDPVAPAKPAVAKAPDPVAPAKPAVAKAPDPVAPAKPAVKAPDPVAPAKPAVAKAPDPVAAPKPAVKAPDPVAPVAVAPPPAITATAAAAVDDQWGDVDDQLFLPRRRTTRLPPMSATPAPTPAPAPAPLAGPAPSAPQIAPPMKGIIPTAALRVLQSAGAPRSLPKLPDPPGAIPRAGRTAVAVDVRIHHAGTTIDAHTRDLSVTGFFAVTAARFALGTVVDCELRMPAPSGLSEHSFSTRAKVVRGEIAGYGLVLIDPPALLVGAISRLGGT